MKPLFLLAVAGVLLLSPPAHSRDWGGGSGLLLQAEAQPDKKAPEFRQRGEQDKRPQQDRRHQGRLTDQERRDLHRDLNRANREIYRR